MAAIRHRPILLLSAKGPEELLGPAGKEAARQEVLQAVRAVPQDETGKPQVRDLCFTDLIVE